MNGTPGLPDGGEPSPTASVHFVVAPTADTPSAALLHDLTALPGPWQVSVLVGAEPSTSFPVDDERVEVVRAGSTAEGLAEVLRTTAASHVALLDAADRVVGAAAPAAWLAAARRHPTADLVVGDEVQIVDHIRHRVHVAVPDRISTLSRPVTSGPVLIRTPTARRAGWSTADAAAPGAGIDGAGWLWADLVRRVVAEGSTASVDDVLCERTGWRPRPSPRVHRDWVTALASRTGITATVSDLGVVHLVGPGDSAGAVSVVLPTIGAAGAVRGEERVYVLSLVEQLLAARHDELGEILVVLDAGTPAPVRAALRLLADSGSTGAPLRLIEDPDTEFDFSRKVDLGVAHSRGPVVLLLNDDVEAISADWMTVLTDLLRIEGVGVVGATLLYEDDTVQHAGVVAAEGLAGHFGQGRPIDAPFADGQWLADRSALAVTGACLMTTREVWDLVGGFGRAFPVNYNDLDFCLKARHLGLDVLVAGSARLHHFESRSREPRVSTAEYRAVAARWYDQLVRDPYHRGGTDVVAVPDGEEPVWPSKA